MAAATYFNTVDNTFGAVLPQAQVNVYLVGTTTPASLTDLSGNPSTVNPVATDATGFFQFFTASPQQVDLVVARGGYAPLRVTVTTFNPSIGFTGPISDTGGQSFNVKAAGATGLGVTDDSAAFAGAIASAAAAGAGGALVFVPAGKYLLNSVVTVTSGVTVLVSAGVLFSGAGYLSVSGEAAIVDLRSGLTTTGQFNPTQATKDLGRNNGGGPGSFAQKPFNQDSIDFYDIKANVDSRLNALQYGAFVQDRYAWFIPYGPAGVSPQSVLAIYDTWRPFKDPKSWQAVDLHVATGRNEAEGFLGVTTLKSPNDASVKVYLCPNQTTHQTGFVGTLKGNAHFFMWDSSKGLPTETGAWSHFDGTVKPALVDGHRGWNGMCNDGRYVYFAPGADPSASVHAVMVRYDSTLPFTTASSWQTVNLVSLFDTTVGGYQCAISSGTHIYYLQTQGASTSDDIARFNINGNFTDNADGAWEHVHVSTLSFSGASNYSGAVGAVFVSGRYIMPVPYGLNPSSQNGQVALFDTKDPAAVTLSTSSNAWVIFDLTTVNARCKGYQYGWEAGDFVYLVPTNASDGNPPPFIRWDKRQPFSTATSWSIFTPATQPPWMTSGVYDGTFFYCSPLREYPLGGAVYSGRIYRIYSPDFPAGQSPHDLGHGPVLFRNVLNLFGFGTSTPVFRVDVNGTVRATTSVRSDGTILGPLNTGLTAYGKTVLDGNTATPNLGNSAGVATTLQSFAVAANSLSANGMYIRFWGEGPSATNADANKSVAVAYGPVGSTQTIMSVTFTNNAANATWRVEGTIMRASAGNQEAGAHLLNQAGTDLGYQRVSGTKDETLDWVLVFVGNGTTLNDVVLKSCGWELHRGQT